MPAVCISRRRSIRKLAVSVCPAIGVHEFGSAPCTDNAQQSASTERPRAIMSTQNSEQRKWIDFTISNRRKLTGLWLFYFQTWQDRFSFAKLSGASLVSLMAFRKRSLIAGRDKRQEHRIVMKQTTSPRKVDCWSQSIRKSYRIFIRCDST